MRIIDLLNELNSSSSVHIEEAKTDNKKTRYNTEVGLLVGCCGIDPTKFDPLNPSDPITGIPANMLKDDGKKVYKDIITFLGKNFDRNMFEEWAGKAADYMSKVTDKLGSTPKVFDWAGGSNKNDEGAADIEFVGFQNQGISVKAASGITLKNLTPKALGISVERGNDVFYQYAGTEYKNMKTAIFKKLLDIAKDSPGEKLSFHSQNPDKYWIMYTPAEGENKVEPVQPVPNELDNIKKNAGIKPAVSTPQPVEEPVTPEVTNESSDSGIAEGKWTCSGKTSFTGTREQIMNNTIPNKKWHRVFGDWFQKNYSAEKELATPLYSAVANMFKDIMVGHLEKDRNLDSVLAMGKRSYFYVNDKDIFYVPSNTEISDLQLKQVYYGSITGEGEASSIVEAEGTSQKFQATVGRPDSTSDARILIYIRYANGMFESNPTVRVQDLRYPEFLGWEKLN
jgi:hypothetical protein